MTTRYYLVKYTREIHLSKLFARHRYEYIDVYPGVAADGDHPFCRVLASYNDEASALDALKHYEASYHEGGCGPKYLLIDEYAVEEADLTDDEAEELDDWDGQPSEYIGEFAGTCGVCRWPDEVSIGSDVYTWSASDHCYLYNE